MVASDIIQEVVELLSIGIINLILILNPEIIVFGGDICNLPGKKELFLDPIKAIIQNAIPFHIPKICFSSLGEDAGLIGASNFAIRSLLVRYFPYKIENKS